MKIIFNKMLKDYSIAAVAVNGQLAKPFCTTAR
jgi:hypothetical protein